MIEEVQKKISQLKMNQVVEWLTALSLVMKATDIHFEAAEKSFKLRLRIDGVLEEVAEVPKELFLPVVAEIKELSGMKIEVHQKSQDGRFKIELPDKSSYDTRVSVIPSGYGESVIIRVLMPDIAVLSLESLGFRPEVLKRLRQAIKSPNGILFVTGPTSSGKTTTLYAILSQLNRPEVKIFTIEDPIEYRLQGVVQTQINQEEDYTFADALRALLRQNPNIIMVGEIRDEETAKTAIQASLTGHFVLTTIHTNSSAETFQRLSGLGLEAGDVATAVRIIIAQRLVRKLCPDCKKEIKIEKELKEEIERDFKKIPDIYKKDIKELKLYQPVGCQKCHQRGFVAQVGIYELLITDKEIQKIILTSNSSLEIEKAAQERDMLTLYQDGLLKAIEGITTFDEVERVAGKSSFENDQ